MSETSQRSQVGRTVALVVGLLVVPVIFAIYLFKLPPEEAFRARTEEGIVEQATHWIWYVTIGVTLLFGILYRWRKGLLGAWIFLALTFRELDFHIRFTPENMNSIRFWKSGEISIPAKLLAFAFIAFTAWAIFQFFRGSWPWFKKIWCEGSALARTIIAIFAFIAFAYGLDNVLDMDDLENPRTLFFSILEETVETGIPVLILVAVIQWRASYSPKKIQIE